MLPSRCFQRARAPRAIAGSSPSMAAAARSKSGRASKGGQASAMDEDNIEQTAHWNRLLPYAVASGASMLQPILEETRVALEACDLLLLGHCAFRLEQ